MASKKNTSFTDPYGLLKQEEEATAKKSRSMLDDLGDIFSGINATRLMTEQDRELNDLAWKYNYDDSLSDEQRESLRNDYINKYNAMYENVVKADEAKKALQNSGTTLGNLGSHALSAGSSIESMQEQYKYNLLGALAGGAVGAIAGGGVGAVPGAIAGWKMANVPSSLLVNYRDAEAGAYDAWNEVMEKTGDKDLAQQAFYEALKPNLAYAGAAAIPDIIIGGNISNVLGKGGQLLNKSSRFAKAMERAQASKLGRGISSIANSPIGTGVKKVADKIDDIDFGEGVGAWVANKTGLPMAGKAARAGAQVFLEDLSEVGQETEQGIATNVAVDKALNPNAEGWTLNRFGDWVNSKQGQETMLDTLVATTLTAGLGAGVGSSFSRLRDGYNNKYNLQRTDYITKELGEGGLLSNPEYRENLNTLKEVVAPLYNRDASTITDDEAVRLNLEDMSERMQQQGMTEEEASTYAFNNLVNRIAGQTGRMDYTSDISEQIMKKNGITNTQGLINKETRQRNESEALQKAKTQSGEQVQAKEVHTGTFNDDTTSFTDKVNEAKNSGVETPTQVEKNRQTGTFGDLMSKRIGNYWVRRDNPTIADGSAELDDNTLIYENTLTNKVLQLKRLNNDKISVTDITPDNVKDANGNAVESGSGQGRLNIPKKPKATFTVTQNGLGNVIKYMTQNEKTTTRMMETDEQQESAPLNPNRRQWSGNSARDLADFYRNNKDLMDADTYMLTAQALMNYGNKNITLNLDLENQNPNGLGDATPVVKDGVAGAIINLYKGANVVTVLHEFAHVGYDMMSEHEQQLYNRMAQATEEQYIVDTLQRVLPEIYGGIDKKELTGLVRNAVATKTGTEWKAINDIGMLRQTVSMLDQSASEEDKQEAFEERFAWDFSLWYMEGYTKGKKPTNRMESMLQRICHKLRRELRLIGSVAQRLQSDGWQNVSYKSMQTMFENMDTRNRQPDANDYTFTSPFDTTRYAIPPTMFGANPQNETQTMPSTAYIPNFTTDGQTYSGNQLAGVTPFQDDNVEIAANMLYDRYKGNPKEMLQVLQDRMNTATSRQEIEFLQKVGQQVIQKELAARGETVNDRGVFYAGQREEEEVAEPTPAEGQSQKRSYRRSVTWGTARDLFNRMMNGDKEAEDEFRKLPFDQQRSVSSNYTMNQSRLENMSFGTPQAIEEGGRNVVAKKVQQTNDTRERKINEVLEKLRSKSPQGLNIFLKNKAFQNNPIYVEAKKRFEEEQQRQQEVEQQPTEQVQEVQPEVRNEVQQQEQVKPASQTVQTEEAQPVVESKEEETTKQVEEPKAEVKEETTNGKTEDSGRVEDIRGTEGEVQTGRDSGVSTNQRPVLRPELRDKLEGTEAGHGEDVSLLRDKNDKPIGRKIPNINDKDSKTMQNLVEKAYGGNMPTDLSGWKQITKSKNKNGDNAITIYNKLFGTDLKEENYSDGDIYIYEDGSAGYAVDNNGFCTVQVSGKKKGLLANAILVARNTKGVRYICANTDGFTTASICSRLGFEPSGVLRVNGEERIVMRKVDMSEEDIIKGINAKSKPVIETKNLPIFYSQESLQKYDSVVENSEDKKQLTREDTTRTLDRVRRAVELFPSTSDDELQYLADTIDDTLSKKNSTSKTSSENLYLMNVLSDAAKEELNNRSGKAETDSEGEIVNNADSVLESIYGAQELADERKKSKADTHTADELLSVALQPWRKREDKEQNNIKTAADESQTTQKKNTDTSKEDLSSILDKLESSLEDIDEQTNYANRVIDVAEREGYTQPTWLEEGVLDFDVDEDLNGLNQKQLENKMSKPKKEREAEKKEVKSEADEEAQAMEEAYDDMPEQAKPKNIHIQNSKVKQLNRYDTEDDWHRVCMSTITSDQGRNSGIKEKDDVSPSYVRNFLNGLKGKYEEDSATTLEEGILGTDIDEEDKKELGRIYRKLSRQKALMDERFSKGLYGDWTDKTGDIFHIRTHAINYYKRLNKSLLGRVKMIMRNNGIHAFEYGFDEKDTKKKLTPKKLAELRKTAEVVQDQIDLFKEQRDSLKGQKGVGKQRRKLTRQISLLEDALNEIKTAVWANGQDMSGLTGKNKFSEEYAEANQNAWRIEKQKQQRESKPAKSVDKDLENSQRQKTIRNAQKRAEERRNKSTPVLDTDVNTNEAQLQDQESWKKFFNGFKKNIEPLYKNARQNLKSLDDILKFRTLKEMVKLSKAGKDVEGMFNNVEHLVNEAEKNGHLSKEQANEHREKINDMRNTYLKETGQNDKVVETKSKQPTMQEQTKEDTTQYAPSNKETKKRANQITKELEEVAKPYFAVGVTDIGGGAVSKQMLEDAIRVSVPMKKLINKYFGKNVDYSQISKEEAECLDRMNTILDKIKEIKKHYDNLKKGKFTPMFSKSNQTTTKPNKTESKPKSTAKVTTEKQQKSTPVVAKNETTQGKPVSDKSFTNRMKLFVDNLKNGKESRTTVAKEGEVLTPQQQKLVDDALKKYGQKKKSKSKTRHMETDTIPETPVEENRDVHSITFTKDALKESKVNRDRAKQLEDNDKYWVKNENEDGSITFTRKSIQPWHTKEITYSGMNGRQVQKKKYEKLSDAAAWFKDKMTEWWFNDKDALKKIADMVGAPLEWMKFVVTKDIGSVASAAIERGIVKHNSKTHERTAALKDIVNAIPKDKQTKFLEYCEAYRIVYDLAPRGIEQKMGVDEANDLIKEVESSDYADLFKEQRKNFIEYNKELLHVLVDGDIISEDFYQALVRDHPNFIPLSKDMSDFNDAFDFTRSKKDLINVKNPLHRIGTSLREVKNPFLEMQKRTFDYYQRAADNKAARIFIDQILQKITRNADGDEVMLNQALIHKLKTQYNKNGTVKDISDDNKGIFYVMKDGKKEFYQLSDASVFKALKSMSPEQMDSFDRFVSYVLSRPAAFVRFFATITPDFGLGNLIRDNGEAFLTSRHGFIPLYDSLWGMWQMKNDTEWFREYNSQVGEMGTRMRESDRLAVDRQDLSDRVKDNPVIKPFFKLNEYLEQGTRIAEYKNARMGYKGTLGRLKGESADLSKAKNSKEYAAYRSKDITLDFQQHGSLGKKFNRYVPFFNASMQGLYKVLNFIDEAWNNKEGMRPEFLLKAALISFLAMSAGLHGAGDDDYEEAPEWEKNNYYVLGNGLRIPKDQVLGKLIGNTFEKFGYQLAKGEVKGGELGQKLFESIRDNAIPDNLTPAFINLAIGLMGNYDTFRKKHITPEYLQDKISYLQKDMSTAQFSADMSKALYNAFGIELGAKKIDYAFNNLFSNTMKYWNKLYDMARQGVTGEKQNERMGQNYLDEDSKWSSDWLNTNTGNDVLDNVLDIAKMMVSKKFIQNQTSFKSIENFNEEYRRLKRLSSDPERMTKDDERLLKNFYEPAVKKIKANQKKLSEINKDESLDRNQKLQKARPIILKNIEIARWANSKKK